MKTIVSSLESRGWTPTSSKIYNDPTTNEHVSWFTLDKTQLLIEEINTVRDLLDLEPESACKLECLDSCPFDFLIILKGLYKRLYTF
jgi:hypothetical protein